VAIDATSGRYYGLDRVQGRLEEIMPHGGGAILLPAGLLPQVPLGMAIDGKTLFVAGRACQCVVAIDLFASRDVTIVAEEAGEISALAAGAGWLAVADGREKVLRLYRAGALAAEIDFPSLRLADPRGMAIANQTLYVADAGSRRLVTFRMRT
jgi:sugar lactone lactonase YvrE